MLPPRSPQTLALLGAFLLAALPARAAEPADDPSVVQIRTVEARRRPVTADVVFTGDIQPQAQTNVAFRTNGKVAERLVEVGNHVEADQVLARLDPMQLKADVDNAQAALTSAQATLTQAKIAFRRQEELIKGGYTTRPSYDNAEQQQRTAQAAVESANAALGTAKEQFSYTELRAGVPGIVMSRDFETGQVVQAGQTVMVLAQDGGRDAVFNVYEALPANPPASKEVSIVLQADPSVTTTGTVREISPTVDAASGTVRVKIGLKSTPPEMTLGAVVIGRGKFRAQEAYVLPWSSLFRWQNGPAVWVYDRGNGTVTPRPVEIARYGTDSILVAKGVEDGEAIVAAGIQFLRPGQSVYVAQADTSTKETERQGGAR